MRLIRRLAAIALIGAAGCGPSVNLQDEFRESDQVPFEQKLKIEISAPIIVVGRVLEVTRVGKPRHSSGDPRVGTQLNRIKISVETVIQGDVGSDAIEFDYFAFSAVTSRIPVKPTYEPAVGQRRIYFLRPSQSGYRSVRDVLDYTLRVNSGTHNRTFCQGMSVGCCIAQILLVPQRDVNLERYAMDIVTGSAVAEMFCSRQMAEELLRRLVEYPDERISEMARQLIADMRRSLK